MNQAENNELYDVLFKQRAHEASNRGFECRDTNPIRRKRGPRLALSSPTACQQCQKIRFTFFGTKLGAPLYNGTSLGLIEGQWRQVDLYPKFSALEASAASGCEFCGLLRTAVIADFSHNPIQQTRETKQDESEWNRRVDISLHNMLVPHTLEVLRRMEGHFFFNIQVDCGWAKRMINFDVFTDKRETLHEANLEQERLLPLGMIPELQSSNPISTCNIELVQRWVQDCIQGHHTCRYGKQKYSPTRLVNVGSLDSTSPLRLALSNTFQTMQPYVALSYCWGPVSAIPPEVRTEHSNINDRLTEIPLHILPQTLRDTILVVRKLGIQYVWIDALCIIQDDPQDWEVEAREMTHIYGNACITIAATSASSMDEGFLKRPNYTTLAALFDAKAEEGWDYSAEEVEDCIGTLYFRAPAFSTFQDLVDNSKWNNRGWTFQERRLSRRLLHFTGQFLYFECRNGLEMEAVHQQIQPAIVPTWLKFQSNERFMGGDDEKIPWKFESKLRYKDLVSETALEPDVSLWSCKIGTPFWDIDFERRNISTPRVEKVFDAWYRDITTYSARMLTFPEDKLPALSGLAYATKSTIKRNSINVFDGKYLAGLWMDDVYRGLMWTPRWSYRTSASETYRAPSWSWCSVDGPVIWENELKDFSTCGTSVAESETVTSKEDPMGRVSEGHLMVYGSLFPISRCRVSDGSESRHTIGHRGNIRSDLNVPFSATSDLWLLPVMTGSGYGQRTTYVGLVLEPTGRVSRKDGTDTLEYRRFGTFKVDDQPGLGTQGKERLHIVFHEPGLYLCCIIIV